MEDRQSILVSDVNFEDYLKTLALRKVTVTVPKLKIDIIQIWMKKHWSMLDPYSHLEETSSSDRTTSDKYDDGPNTSTRKTDTSGLYFNYIGGHLINYLYFI